MPSLEDAIFATPLGWKDYFPAPSRTRAEKLIEFWGSPQTAFRACDDFFGSEVAGVFNDEEREEHLEVMAALVDLGAKNVSGLLLEIAL